MQKVTERRPHRSDDDGQDGQDVTKTVSMLSHSTPQQRSLPETWVRFAMDKLWSLVFLCVACLGLYEANFVTEIVLAPHANRNFVHLGIFFGTLLGAFGCYIEVYRGAVLGERVHYESVKTATHGMLASMLASGLCFTVGMWPVWHWLTLPYLVMWSWGVVVQLLVILPPVLQRVVFVGAYCWFMHSYLAMLFVSVQ